jgi:hypothetical protein
MELHRIRARFRLTYRRSGLKCWVRQRCRPTRTRLGLRCAVCHRGGDYEDFGFGHGAGHIRSKQIFTKQ